MAASREGDVRPSITNILAARVLSPARVTRARCPLKPGYICRARRQSREPPAVPARNSPSSRNGRSRRPACHDHRLPPTLAGRQGACYIPEILTPSNLAQYSNGASAVLARGPRSPPLSREPVPLCVSAFTSRAHGPLTLSQMYDYAVTLLDEVQLVWPAAWGPGKILFLLARYMTWPEVSLAIYRASPRRLPFTSTHSPSASRAAVRPPRARVPLVLHLFLMCVTFARICVQILRARWVDSVRHRRCGE